MTEEQAQLRLVKIMSILKPKGPGCDAYIYVPSKNGIEDDIDFLQTLVTYTMFDLEAKVREAEVKHGQ